MICLLNEFQRDGITICTTFTPFKPENTRLLARKNDIIICSLLSFLFSRRSSSSLSVPPRSPFRHDCRTASTFGTHVDKSGNGLYTQGAE